MVLYFFISVAEWCCILVFFFKQKTAYEMRISDWSSDVCSSDLKLRGVFNFPLGYYHIVVYADSGITRLQDVKGKRVFLGPPGGGATVNMAQMLEIVTGYKAGHDYEQEIGRAHV